MAIAGWLLDKSVVARAGDERVARQLRALDGPLLLCEVGALEQLYSARSAKDYDALKVELLASFEVVRAPANLLEQALELQHDLADHHGMWHRTPIPDLLIAVTALHHDLGVAHMDGDFDRIAKVRPLQSHRLR